MFDPDAFFSGLIIFVIGGGLFFGLLFLVIRGAVTEGMKGYARWREAVETEGRAGGA